MVTLVGVLIGLSAVKAEVQLDSSAAEVQFDIPAQPLADALVAYGSTTGLQVFYDGALAVDRRSTAVKGSFAPMAGLQLLLRGTGFIPRATDNPDTFTIVAGSQAPVPVPQAAAQLHGYDSYFATLQARVTEALCESDDESSARHILFSVWVGTSGRISRAEVVGRGAGAIRTKSIAGMEGLWIGAPPSGLPQPVTMMILPRIADEPAGCRAANGRRAAH